ncbi:hypothetical protein HY625_03490 [Candidatus Uhrbacteria bacterium]|nr:hypothetical protein [Candidatus Uhrbacteria bacterium]
MAKTPPKKEVIDVPPEPLKKDTQPVSQDIQIIDPKPMGTASDAGRKDHNIIIGTLNVSNAGPVGRYLAEPLRRRYHRHYHPRHKHGTKHLVADIFLALTVSALIGFNAYLFFFSAPGLQEKVGMTISVLPETIRSGEPITMIVDYDNRNAKALLNAELSILCPCSAMPGVAEPSDIYNPTTHTFRIGTIPPHGNGSVRFSWKFFGTVGETQHFSAALSYGAEGAVARETKSALWRAPVNDSTLHLSIIMPAEFVHESTVPFVLRYQNIGREPLQAVRLEPAILHGVITESAPKLDNGAWIFPVLAPGATGEVNGRMAFTGAGESETDFIVRMFAGESRILQREEKHHATVFYPKLAVVPSSDSAEAALSLGGVAPLVFAYENGEADDVVDFSLALDPPTNVFITNDKTALVVSKKQDPSLALLRAGAKGELTLSVPVRSSIERKEVFGNGDPIVRIPYVFSYRLASAPQNEIRVERVVERKVNSDLALHAFGRYYTPEGDQLGRGALPPRVDETTRYWIFLPVTNTISDVEDVVVTATLGLNIEWTKKSSVTLGDPLMYDAVTRIITWRLANVTKFSGGAYPDVGAAIEVALTPNAEQAGTEPVLLDAIRLKGKDTFTGATIDVSADPVTTALTVDQRAKGKGKVVR